MKQMPNPVSVGLLISAYLALLLWGVSLIEARRAPVPLVATRDLPFNHLVQPGDLALSANGRQYLPHSLRDGEGVNLGELVALPDVTRRPGRVSRTLMVPRAEVNSGAIDSGVQMLICPLAVSADVRAAVCGDVGPCFAIVDVADADAEKIGSADEVTLKSQCG